MFWWRHVWFHVVRCGLVMLWSYCDVIRRFDVVSVWGCDVVVVWRCSGACFLRGGVVWYGAGVVVSSLRCGLLWWRVIWWCILLSLVS